MHISFNTEDLTEHDRAVLAFIASGGTDAYAASLENTGATFSDGKTSQPVQVEKPKRARRTNAEIAFDSAKEAFDADRSEANGQALFTAAEELKAKDPSNDRLTDLDLSEFAANDEPDTDTDAEAAIADEQPDAVAVSPEQAKELASKLITDHRDKAIEILKALGVKKFSELTPEQLPEFASRANEVLAGS